MHRGGQRDVDACRPSCAQELVDRTRRDALVADASLVLGVALAGAAAWTGLAGASGTANVTVSLGPAGITLGGWY
jgi:hypothetical protein